MCRRGKDFHTVYYTCVAAAARSRFGANVKLGAPQVRINVSSRLNDIVVIEE